MNENVTFNPAAIKHRVTEENICHVLNNPWYEGPVEEYENKHIVIGFDKSGKLLEILYNRMDDDIINVFHAMKCRNIYFHLVYEP